MDDKQLQQLAHEIANQTAFHNLEYWLTLVAIALIAAAAGYLGSYFAKRGEHAANKADLDKILVQLAQTTRMTASIQSVVSLGEWSERERRTLRRIKLEELMVAVHRSDAWMDLECNRLVYLSGADETTSPLPLMVTLGKLFFPELRSQISTFSLNCNSQRHVFRKVYGALLAARSNALDAVIATGNQQGWPEHLRQEWEAGVNVRAGPAQIAVRETFNGQLLEALDKTYRSLLELDESAAALMADIIAAPAAS